MPVPHLADGSDASASSARNRNPNPVAVTILYIAGASLCGWAMLRCMGNERESRARLIEDRVRAEHDLMAQVAEAAKAPAAVSASPAGGAGPKQRA